MGEEAAASDDRLAGVIRHLQTGRLLDAERLCRQLVEAEPESHTAALLWGVVLHQLGRLGEAEAVFRRTLEAAPLSADAHLNLGSTLSALGRFDDAAESYAAAIRIDPGARNAHYSLGHLHLQRARPAEAIEAFRTAVTLDRDFAEAHLGLGMALRLTGSVHKAAEAFDTAARLQPESPEPHYHLAGIRQELAQPEAAAQGYRTAIRLNPGFAAAHNELGTVLREMGHPAEAIAHFRAAIRLHPGFAEAHNNMGAARSDLGHLAAAIGCYRAALRCNPELADAHFNLGSTLLLAGEAAAGWAEYEWRWQTPQMAQQARSFVMPRWQGEPLRGRTILLHAEQGLGDTLQFCRFVPLVAAQAKVVLEVQPELVSLLSAVPGIGNVLPRGAALPACDVHCPLMSLPFALGAGPPSGSHIPYLRPNPAAVAAWRRRLAELKGLRVGLVWAAGRKRIVQQRHAADRRSVALEWFEPLTEIPGVRLVSLQKELPPEHARAGRLAGAMHDITHALADFTDTAAAVLNLDLVITVDTAVAHLCGALGAPAWVLNRFESDWRWPRDRDDTPWYPTLRQFRQRTMGNWPEVIGQVALALGRLAAGDLTQLRPRAARLPLTAVPYPGHSIPD